MKRMAPMAAAALLAASIAFAPALAQTPEVRHGEGMDVVLPQGWTAIHTSQTRQLAEVHAVPGNQDPGAWTDLIAYAEYKTLPSASPVAYLEAATENVRERCPRVRPGRIQQGTVNGYPTAFLLMSCPVEPLSQRGEVTLMKVTAGEKSLYLVQRTWRTPAYKGGKPPVPEEQLRAWVDFLKQRIVCDTTEPDRHPCRAPASR